MNPLETDSTQPQAPQTYPTSTPEASPASSTPVNSTVPSPTLTQEPPVIMTAPVTTQASVSLTQQNTVTQAVIDKTLSEDSFFDKLLSWTFRVGFASIFLVNAVYAAIHPNDFISLLQNNPITNAIGFTDFMVKIAMVNDLLLGVFLLGGWRKKYVYAWAGAWLLLVAGLKIINLFV